MHVLYLHQYFVPPDGSGGTRSYEMARRLVKAGHRVTMITSSASFPASYGLGGAPARLELEGIELRVIPVPYSNKLSYARRIKAFLDFAVKACLESRRVEGVDVVFATSTPLTIALPAVLAKRAHGKPMVFEVRDLWPELPIAIGALRHPLLKFLARRLELWAYANADRVVALSPGMKDGVARTGYRPERVAVVPNSCDVELFRVPPAAGEAFAARHPHLKGGSLVVYAGTLGPINGVEYLVDVAAAMLPLDPSVRFLIVGDGKRREEVAARARAAGVLERNLWLLPPGAKKDMPAVLSAASVAVSLFIDLPEMWHNSANKFFDALAAGRPIMINYRGWQADIVEREGLGVAAPARDPAAAAAALRAFLADEAAVRAAREASARLADTEFNRDRLFAKLLAVLEDASAEARA